MVVGRRRERNLDMFATVHCISCAHTHTVQWWLRWEGVTKRMRWIRWLIDWNSRKVGSCIAMWSPFGWSLYLNLKFCIVGCAFYNGIFPIYVLFLYNLNLFYLCYWLLVVKSKKVKKMSTWSPMMQPFWQDCYKCTQKPRGSCKNTSTPVCVRVCVGVILRNFLPLFSAPAHTKGKSAARSPEVANLVVQIRSVQKHHRHRQAGRARERTAWKFPPDVT